MREQHAQREALDQLRELGEKHEASFQVIVLGSSGGPREDNVTGLLVRAPQTEWRKSSMIAVDAGSHLANIIRILERQMPSASETLPPKDYSRILDEGPFAGIRFPNISAKANGLHIFRQILHAFLITHPHLDHLSAMAINTPALEYGREAKAIVALPSTIEAIKNHIFNDWLWPNLSDEGNGVGFVTYRRLIEGGNPRLGSGDSRGYVNVCDGLATKCWSISHGKCQRGRQSFSGHQHSDSFGYSGGDYTFPSRRMSRISDASHDYFAAVAQQQQQQQQATQPYLGGGVSQMGMSMPTAGPMTPGIAGVPPTLAMDPNHMFEPVGSSAFFVRNDVTGNEILIFGDVEPDSVSMSPRNHTVWEDAAGKVVSGALKAIFIECSYDDSVRNEDLYGHLCPRHLIAELSFLAKSVVNRRKQQSGDPSVTSVDGAGAGTMTQATGNASMSTGAVPDMSMRQPPTPAELKRKRKRAAMNGGSNNLATTPELAPTVFDNGASTGPGLPSPMQPLASSAYVGTRASSHAHAHHAHGHHAHTRRRTSREATSANVASTLPPPGLAPLTPGGGGRAKSVQFQPGPGPDPDLSSGGGQIQLQASNVGGQSSLPRDRDRLAEPLSGITVHIIHVKDTLMDGPSPGDVIVQQLRAQGDEAGLGVEFNVTKGGDSIWI
ncbi:3',5'-cyclic-nucleotide phosphodiesterase pde1 [Exophiala xenobiotica]|uniref:3',5'-cyclic-nucleotide phosphodiesterase pde1 n=1 Tax=Vermiconidia calcicola TaxID=1690605 RepID=A0AAV9Q3M5_9PEZI|nr:3',5'-cyclic-nucleotide phosphodiesterase pde1 [Exophiala xenobiotica]KAK5534528.1 3',5'-cyclic-nucleotide phosphodiesterase pde1 [Vermiconidia calcicola]KAK5544590.1 3',5'-cyclic-nucleotide phosphodiesterase pde1 [Chaetothyriales sp. CCFEE 6169]KAK5266807.1 3',5'-cyclic-nucleotide phosphodiesterase pde1 [Exophiala xenobiotica]KAK5299151.1 3',5'-cyclic-nucleotide phosphodiesterase pde1 [Exophiala xenobiotica]